MIKKLYALATVAGLSVSAHAFEVTVPLTADAKVFAKFVDEYPAVVNYFSQSSEQEIIQFYTDKFGQPLETILEKNRTRIIFMDGDKVATVIISQQGNAQQVDVLVR